MLCVSDKGVALWTECEVLQNKIHQGKENNLDENEIIKLKKEFDYKYKLLLKEGKKWKERKHYTK